MPLEIVPFVLGEMDNNTYLAADPHTRRAVVIDPSFDSEIILEEAARRQWQITAIWLTHAHFDHIAGARLLVDAFQPPIPVGLHPEDFPLLKQGGGAKLFGIQVKAVPAPALHFEHGQQISLGKQLIEVRHTPGHTLDSVCLLVTDRRRGEAPWFAVTGDTLFVGAIGRPDLAGREAEMAAMLYDSLHGKLLPLPDELEIFPGHQAGSVCGAGLSGKPSSTLGFEKRWNPALSMRKADFVRYLTAEIPPRPDQMDQIVAANIGA